MQIFHSARRLWRRLRGDTQVSPQAAARLASLAAAAQDDDLNCDGVHELIDQFCECAARGENAAALMPLVQRHLERCPGCQEEYEALLRIIEGEHLNV
jgi:hypothetical protein